MSAAMLKRARDFYRKTGSLQGAARLIGLTTAELDWLMWTGARNDRAGATWTAWEDRVLKLAYLRFSAKVIAMGLGRSEWAVNHRAAILGAYHAEAA